MKFGDRQNRIDNAIRTGVIEDDPTTDSSHNIPNPDISANAIQHEMLVANEENHVENVNDTKEADIIEIEDGDEIEDEELNVSNNGQEDNIDSVAPESM